MSQSDKTRPGSGDEQERRKERLAEELRANLQRRKTQARSRRSGEADARAGRLIKPEGDAGENKG
jgi:hypothetical protein